MKKTQISALTALLLTSTVMVSVLNATDIVAPANITTTSSGYFGLNLDKTDYGSGAEWYIRNNPATNQFMIHDDVDDSTHNNTLVFGIEHSLDNENSIIVDSSGDIGLADGSVFIDRSADRMGIGTVAPEESLHVKSGGGNMILEGGTYSKWQIATLAGGGFWLRDLLSSSTPFRIDGGAPTSALHISNTGYIGVGMNTPTEMVDVLGTDEAARFKLTSVTNTGNEAAQFVQQRARSNSGSPAAVESGDVIGFFSFRGWNGTGWTGTKAGISVTATEDWSSTENGNLITISHTPNGSSTLTAALQIKGQSDVYIPNGNLYVKGSKMNVPDYVFKENYKLMPLDELKAYVKKNNHLPGVASADEVDKAGVVNLSSLQMTLLEKVEELTLYTLQQEEQIADQKAKIAKLEAMQKRLSKVESLLTNLALDTSGSTKEKVSMK